ncbi:hypothetical protein E2562_017148, partial [Oryza meyeriana var. granulata]
SVPSTVGIVIAEEDLGFLDLATSWSSGHRAAQSTTTESPPIRPRSHRRALRSSSPPLSATPPERPDPIVQSQDGARSGLLDYGRHQIQLCAHNNEDWSITTK